MELMKVQSAVSHYIDHESHEHPDESFLDFLYEHYVMGEHSHEKGGHCDDEMPFKHCGDCGSHQVVVLPFTLPGDASNISIPDFTVQFPVEAKEQFVSSCNIPFWQPPKIS
jgi:hypothetical protein